MTSSNSPAAPAHINHDSHKPASQHTNNNIPAPIATPDTADTLPPTRQPPPPYIDPALLSALVYQLDYYFSPVNLYSDTFLLSQMDATRAVPVATIASFRKIQLLTTDIHTVLAAMQHCSNLILDATATSVRPASISNVQRTTVVLRDVPNDVDETEVTAIFNRAGCPGLPVSVYCDTRGEWSCVMDNDDVCVETALWLTSQSLRDQPIKARVKSDATKPHHSQQLDGAYSGYMTYPPYNPYAPQPMYGNGVLDYGGGMYGGGMYNPYVTQQQPGMPYMPQQPNGIDYHIPLLAGAPQPGRQGEGNAETGEVLAAPALGKKKKKKASKAAKAAAAAAAATALAAAVAAAAASTAVSSTSVSAPVTPAIAASPAHSPATSTTVTSAASTTLPARPFVPTGPSSIPTSHTNIPLIAPSSYDNKSEPHRPVSMFSHPPAASIVTAAAFPPISALSMSSSSAQVHSAATALSAPTSLATSVPSDGTLPVAPSAATAATSKPTPTAVNAPVLLNYASKVGSMPAAEVAKVAAAAKAKAARDVKLKADSTQTHSQPDKSGEDGGELQHVLSSNKENTHVDHASPAPSRPSSASTHREGVWVRKDTIGSNSTSQSGGSSGASTSPSWRERSREYPKRIHAPHPQRFGGYGGRQFGHAGQSPVSSTSASSTASSSSSPSSPSSSSSTLSASTPTPETKRPVSYAELIKRGSVSPSPTAPSNGGGKAIAAVLFAGNGPASPQRHMHVHMPPLHPATVSMGQAAMMGAPVSPAGSSASI